MSSGNLPLEGIRVIDYSHFLAGPHMSRCLAAMGAEVIKVERPKGGDAGRAQPELGGHPRYLDVVGVNFYHDNQWEHPSRRLRWEDNPRDERWVPFHRLLARAHARYGRPRGAAR